MIREAFQIYLTDKNQLFEKHFKNLMHNIRDQDVKELRTCIMKLRSAYYFLESQKILKSSDAKYKHEMRQLYKTSGSYREMAIFNDLAVQFEKHSNSGVPFLKNHLIANKNKLSVQMANAINNFNIDNHAEFSGNLLLKINAVGNKKIKIALENHLKKLKNQSEKMLMKKGTEWNELRKYIKGIYYLYPVVEKAPDISFVTYLKHITDRLGYWRDCKTCSMYLTDYVILHEVFEYENRIIINDMVRWLKNQATAQVKGIKKGLRKELDTIQKIGLKKD